MELPEIEEDAVSESEEEEVEDRGVYHREVSTGAEPTSVFRDTAHPVSIEGKCYPKTLKQHILANLHRRCGCVYVGCMGCIVCSLPALMQ